MSKLNTNSTAMSRQNCTLSAENDREVHALSEWINALLSPPGLDVENSFEIGRLLEKTTEANNKLKEILMSLSQLPPRVTTPQKLKTSQKPNTPLKLNTPQKSQLDAAAESLDHIDLSILRRKRLNEQWRQKASELYNFSDVPGQIFQLVESGQVGIRKGLVVSAHIGLQVDILALLLNFHPIWLKLALETVFGMEILLPDTPNASASLRRKMRFVPTVANFIRHNLFTSEALVKRGKGLVVGPDVVILLHKHFLSKLCQMLFVIENIVVQSVVPNIPCMFLKGSQYKSMHDVYGYLSREVIAGSTNLPKMLARVGFEAKYKQGFFEEYNYQVDNFLVDLSDGIIMAKIIETLSAKDGHLLGSLISRLRNPSGDRIRKVYNVRTVLTEAAHRFPTKFQLGEIKAEDIVAMKRNVIVKFVLQLAGIQENAAVIRIQAFLRNVQRRNKRSRVVKANIAGKWIQEIRAVNLIQTFFRKEVIFHKALITVQAFFRQIDSMCRVKAEKCEIMVLRLREQMASTYIQVFLSNYIPLLTAVVEIQATFRHIIAMSRVNKEKKKINKEKAKLTIACIQTIYNNYVVSQ